jgi:hypothetical protein
MTEMMTAVDSFFEGPKGIPSLNFSDVRCIDYPRGGIIVDISNPQQQLNYDTKEPDFWKNKKGELTDQPIMVVVVTLQTNEADPSDPQDTGLRRVFLPQSKNITKAVLDGYRRAGAPGLRVGGKLMITRTGPPQNLRSQAYEYRAEYTPPAPSHDSFFENGAAQLQQAAQYVATSDTAQQQTSQPAGQQPWAQNPAAQQPAPQAGQQPWAQNPAAQQTSQPAGQQPWAQNPAAQQTSQPAGQQPWQQPTGTPENPFA